MNAKQAVASLAALAQDSRLSVYRLLVEAGPTGLAVGEIGASLEVAPATLSFHLKELSHAGLVMARQEGRYIYYSANYDRMSQLLGYLTENCCARDNVSCGSSCAAPGCEPAKRSTSGGTRRGASKTSRKERIK